MTHINAKLWLVEKIKAEPDDERVMREAEDVWPGSWTPSQLREAIKFCRDSFARAAEAEAAAAHAAATMTPKFCAHCGQKLQGVA